MKHSQEIVGFLFYLLGSFSEVSCLHPNKSAGSNDVKGPTEEGAAHKRGHRLVDKGTVLRQTLFRNRPVPPALAEAAEMTMTEVRMASGKPTEETKVPEDDQKGKSTEPQKRPSTDSLFTGGNLEQLLSHTPDAPYRRSRIF
jgi:hypothetical protein